MQRTMRRTMLGLLAVMALLAGQVVVAKAESPALNINTASAQELATIKGIGPAKAKAIVDHREANGAFKSVDDLKMVRGIGDNLLEQLRPQVTVEGEAKTGKSAKH
jgi:competence protein ComEA